MHSLNFSSADVQFFKIMKKISSMFAVFTLLSCAQIPNPISAEKSHEIIVNAPLKIDYAISNEKLLSEIGKIKKLLKNKSFNAQEFAELEKMVCFWEKIIIYHGDI